MLRQLAKKLLIGSPLEKPLRDFLSIRFRIRLVNFIFQRILRINGRVPWSVHYTSIVEGPQNLRIGRSVAKSFAVSGHCYIQGFNGIEIGDHTIFAPGVKIISTNHDEVTHASTQEPPIRIGNHCWLGANSIILPGVTLGDNVIVGAGAVVTKSFPCNVTIAGVPARVVRQRKTTDLTHNYDVT